MWSDSRYVRLRAFLLECVVVRGYGEAESFLGVIVLCSSMSSILFIFSLELKTNLWCLRLLLLASPIAIGTMFLYSILLIFYSIVYVYSIVLYRHPDLDKTELPSLVLPSTYLCRYSLSINQEQEDEPPTVVLLPYTGENDDWNEMTIAYLNCKKRPLKRGGGDGMASQTSSSDEEEEEETADDDDDSDGSDRAPANKRRRVGNGRSTAEQEEGIDEGTTEERDIQVGRDHQVYVPPFARNPQIVSRNPIRMWKPGKISPDGTDEYFAKAAQILTPFLREHHLSQEEPYAPFPTARMEELSKSLRRERLPTLSSVATAASLTGRPLEVLREYNLDALLWNLHVSNYQVDAAIAAIQASPQEYLTVWSPQEKTIFNAAFRRYSGSLRAIYQGMGNKALQEVIDYHYRFKIPDQYRRVQERKREQAVRMLECIETKRNVDAPILLTGTASWAAQQQSGTADEKNDSVDWYVNIYIYRYI